MKIRKNTLLAALFLLLSPSCTDQKIVGNLEFRFSQNAKISEINIMPAKQGDGAIKVGFGYPGKESPYFAYIFHSENHESIVKYRSLPNSDEIEIICSIADGYGCTVTFTDELGETPNRGNLIDFDNRLKSFDIISEFILEGRQHFIYSPRGKRKQKIESP